MKKYINNKYCNSLTSYSRWKTRVVNIGDVSLGGDNPIRVQSMTTTNTMDTIGTVEQSIRMIKAGCEYVRITAPGRKEAENLLNIKNELRKRGYNTPIIADIHFTPKAAEVAARIVEKVRVNPGNYADKKKFNIIEYTDSQYENEIERIRTRFLPVIQVCKEYGTAMRIGANHGSLSDRILSRYGDTPLGMVESALEFLRICNDENYHNIVLSMKSSNPIVMVNAYRLLVNKMDSEGMNYPLHLGVTEAGEGEDGRIKSALGIGALLEDGLGDTIRVSLTEEPEFEIPVAKALVNRISQDRFSNIDRVSVNPINPFKFNLRTSRKTLNIGGDNVPRVVSDLSFLNEVKRDTLVSVGYRYFKDEDKWGISDLATDYIYTGSKEVSFSLPGTLGVIQDYSHWKKRSIEKHYPLMNLREYIDASKKNTKLNFLRLSLDQLDDSLVESLMYDETVVIFLESLSDHAGAEQRRMFIELVNNNCDIPVILSRSCLEKQISSIQINTSVDFGVLLVDGLGDGIFMSLANYTDIEKINSVSFGVLQAARARISKTEYISCPSCGRTLFDLQETTAKIRSKTQHLKGLKIGIMGCIVNGPGEMADADYGYVGTGVGKISLYKQQKMIKKDVPMSEADKFLIDLIKENGDWLDP